MKRIYTCIITLLLCILYHYNTLAQEVKPVIEWQRTMGGSKVDQLLSIIPTPDHGFIMGGYSYSDISGEKTSNSKGSCDYWIIKQDSAGSIQWQKTLGGGTDDVLSCISLCNDGGYIVSGTSFSGADGDKTDTSKDDPTTASYNGGDVWIMKLDSLGTIQWQKTLGGSYAEGRDISFNMFTSFDSTFAFFSITHIEQTTDGGYILGASSTSSISGDKTAVNRTEANAILGMFYPFLGDYWILKLDASGNIQWQQTFGGEDNDRFSVVKQTSDGGYIVGGTSTSTFLTLFGTNISGGDKTDTIRGMGDYWILKLNATGAIQWQKTMGGTGDDWLMSIDLTTDGGYILGGYSSSGISGEKTDTSRGATDYWILKLNALGAIVWQKTIGGNGSEILSSIKQTPDNGFLVAGTSSSSISGEKNDMGFGGASDYWVLKLNSLGNIIWQKSLGGIGSNIERMELPASIAATSDGGYITGGFSDAPISGNKTDSSRGDFDYWVIKLNRCDADTTTVPAAFCALGSYTLPNGTSVQSAGTYYSVLSNENGCDSVIVTQLSEVSISNTLTVNNQLLIAQSIAGATYQWFNCATLETVAGATGNTFQPVTNGFYAAVITLNDCRDTTMCYNFSTITGTTQVNANAGLMVFPNPATDHIAVQSNNGLFLKKIALIDVMGRTVLTQTITQSNINNAWIDVTNVAASAYFLKIETNRNTFMNRVNILK